MNESRRTSRVVFVILSSVIALVGFDVAKGDVSDGNVAETQVPAEQTLEHRVAQLEQRVKQLEQLLNAKSVRTVEDAAARLVAAQEQLRFSQRLYSKGYVSLARLKADELATARAQADLDTAKMGTVNVRSALHIQVLEAEADVAVAEDRLRYTEQMARRGFAAQAEIVSRRSIVETALQKLAEAKSELARHDTLSKP